MTVRIVIVRQRIKQNENKKLYKGGEKKVNWHFVFALPKQIKLGAKK